MRILFCIVILIVLSMQNVFAQVTILNDEAYMAPRDDKAFDDNNYKFQILKRMDKHDLKIPECGDKGLNFQVCEPGICKVSSIMGDVYYRLSMLNNFCHYQERAPKIAGMDCNFDMKALEEINTLFGKRIANTGGITKAISKEEVDRLNYIYEHNCIMMPNANYTKVVTLDDKENALSEVPTDIIDTANLADILKYDPTSNFVKSSEASSGLTSDYYSYSSIMFTSSEIDLIYVLQEIIRSNQRDGRVLDTSSIFANNSLGKFYLNSLIYRNEDHWVVWMNNIKMIDKEENKSLKIEHVAQDKVKFKWLSTNLDKLSPNWKNRMVGIDPEKYISREYDITVFVKGDKAEVIFGLKPNQTFDATTMHISEGKK